MDVAGPVFGDVLGEVLGDVVDLGGLSVGCPVVLPGGLTRWDGMRKVKLVLLKSD